MFIAYCISQPSSEKLGIGSRCREKETVDCWALNRTSVSHSLLPRFGDHIGKEWKDRKSRKQWVMTRKQGFLDTAGTPHILIHRRWNPMHKIGGGSGQTKSSMQRGGRHEFQPLAKSNWQLMAAGRERPFSLTVQPLVGWPPFSENRISRVYGQHKLYLMG